MNYIKYYHSNFSKSNGLVLFENEAWINSDRKEIRRSQHACLKRFLEEALKISKPVLQKKESGAPEVIGSELRISISHSSKWLAMQWSDDDRVGVDVQVIKKGLHRGRKYFVNEREEKSLDLTDENLLKIWCAKETIYKMFEGDLKSFKESITVINFDVSSLQAEVEGEIVRCQFKTWEDFYLMYVAL